MLLLIQPSLRKMTTNPKKFGTDDKPSLVEDRNVRVSNWAFSKLSDSPVVGPGRDLTHQVVYAIASLDGAFAWTGTEVLCRATRPLGLAAAGEGRHHSSGAVIDRSKPS